MNKGFLIQTVTLQPGQSQTYDVAGDFFQVSQAPSGAWLQGPAGTLLTVQFDDELPLPIYGRCSMEFSFKRVTIGNNAPSGGPVTVQFLIGTGTPPVIPMRENQSASIAVNLNVLTVGVAFEASVGHPQTKSVLLLNQSGNNAYVGSSNAILPGSGNTMLLAQNAPLTIGGCAPVWVVSNYAVNIASLIEYYL